MTGVYRDVLVELHIYVLLEYIYWWRHDERDQEIVEAYTLGYSFGFFCIYQIYFSCCIFAPVETTKLRMYIATERRMGRTIEVKGEKKRGGGLGKAPHAIL